MERFDVVIVGGGAAGYFIASNIDICSKGCSVVLLEASRSPMMKVKASGGGRCNVTHCQYDARLFAQGYPRGGRELLGGFSRFGAKDMVDWLADRSVQVRAEKDGRMFPVTNNSSTIVQCLERCARENGVKVEFGSRVQTVSRESSGFDLVLKDGRKLSAAKLIIATGGNEIGFEIAASLGHRVVPSVPSLFTLNIEDPRLHGLAGVSFESVELSLKIGKKKIRQVGPMLITHWGISGPVVLKLSAWAARELNSIDYRGDLKVNFSVNLNEEFVFEVLWRTIQENLSKLVRNLSVSWFSKRYWQQLVALRLPEECQCNQVSKKQIRELAREVCQATFRFAGKSKNKDEFVTAGGVCLKDVDFKTMESRVCPGLYFAGEVLDVDGVTGGFNFQNAWTTGMLCARSLNEAR